LAYSSSRRRSFPLGENGLDFRFSETNGGADPAVESEPGKVATTEPFEDHLGAKAEPLGYLTCGEQPVAYDASRSLS
jgi:hypothetical protein